MTKNYEVMAHEGHRPDVQERTEIILGVPNDLTLLARLFAFLSSKRRNIFAWCFYSDHDRARVLLVTENDSKLSQMLRTSGFESETNSVIVVAQKHRSVSATQVSAELRDAGLSILDAHTCCSLHNGAVVVLRTTDNVRAIEVLEAMDLLQTKSPCVASGSVHTVLEEIEALPMRGSASLPY
jgi:hypothetical protein